jgi:hypothetical protein
MENTNTGMVGILMYRTRHRVPRTHGEPAFGAFPRPGQEEFLLSAKLWGQSFPQQSSSFILQCIEEKLEHYQKLLIIHTFAKLKNIMSLEWHILILMSFEKIHSVPTNFAAKVQPKPNNQL